MTDYILIVSLALLVIGIALFIALPFCRTADDGDDEQAAPVDSKGFPFDHNLNISKPHWFGVDHAELVRAVQQVERANIAASEEGLDKLATGPTARELIDRGLVTEYKFDDEWERLMSCRSCQNVTELTPLECAEARVAMGEPVASAARNEGIPLAELMNHLRVKECQATK